MAIVAVAGATGLIGTDIARGFLDNKAFSEVRILTRGSKQPNPELEAKGAKIIQVDFDDVAALTAALKGVQVVVNSIGGDFQSKVHFTLVDAAKAAGVKRYVPSEFGGDPRITSPKDSFVYGVKADILKHVKASGLEWTVIATGSFLNYLVTFSAIPSLEKGNLTVFGDDNAPFGGIVTSEAGYLVADVVLRPESRNAVINLSAFTVTYREIVATYNELTGKSIQPTIITAKEIEQRIEAAKAQNSHAWVLDELMLAIARGSCRPVEPVTAEWFPNFKFTSVRDLIVASRST